MLYDDLIQEAAQHGIDIYEEPLKTTIKGLYADQIIWINRHIPTRVEKACILAEEIGHYHTSVGDIIDQTDVRNRKQELRARAWAYEKLVPLSKIVQAHHARVPRSTVTAKNMAHLRSWTSTSFISIRSA